MKQFILGVNAECIKIISSLCKNKHYKNSITKEQNQVPLTER